MSSWCWDWVYSDFFWSFCWFWFSWLWLFFYSFSFWLGFSCFFLIGPFIKWTELSTKWYDLSMKLRLFHKCFMNRKINMLILGNWILLNSHQISSYIHNRMSYSLMVVASTTKYNHKNYHLLWLNINLLNLLFKQLFIN